VIKLDNITLARGSKTVLEKTSLTVFDGERVGLVGRNGAGKSSLFALLLKQLDADSGQVSTPSLERMAWVAQEVEALPIPAEQFVLEGDVVLDAIQKKLDTAYETGDDNAIGDLYEQFEHAGGHTAMANARKLLAGLGFSQSELTLPVADFSGGWRMRLNLARALMQQSDALLLDEPTNHLDLDAIVWLEQWLVGYPGMVFVISHDRDFLDAVVKTVVHVDQKMLNRYTGTYTSFEAQYSMRMLQASSAQQKTDMRRAELTKFIDRFGAKASKAKQAQSRAKMLAKLTDSPVFVHEDAPRFRFDAPETTPDTPLRLIETDCGYDAQAPILKQVTVELRAGERIGLLGRNGAGKSTLIKSLCATLPLLSGERHEGKGLVVGYFAQHQIDTLDADSTPLETLRRTFKNDREQALRNLLASYGFKGELALQSIGTLSGGERSRLALAMIAHTKPNVLVLDEPTNHLDLEAREALTTALASFEGTLILVSHDRHMLRATADDLWLVAEGKVMPFDGDLDEYKVWLAKNAKADKAEKDKKLAKDAKANSTAAVATAAVVAPAQKKPTAEERQAIANQRKPLQAELKKLDAQLAKDQAAIAPLNLKLADTHFYGNTDAAQVAKILREHASLQASLEALELGWLEVQDALEALEGL
jgi:ATP-binding cassette, subfamily F, member 3